MAGKTRSDRKMKPVILVICEGETEACYVDFLKQQYRLPIKIVSKIVGSKINQRLISHLKKELRLSNTERIDCFLMYDADVANVTEHILSCGEQALLSRPCIEVWFLAHTEKIPANDLSSDQCVHALEKQHDWHGYKKGKLSNKQQDILWEKRLDAIKNINHELSKDQPFSMIYKLIEILERIIISSY